MILDEIRELGKQQSIREGAFKIFVSKKFLEARVCSGLISSPSLETRSTLENFIFNIRLSCRNGNIINDRKIQRFVKTFENKELPKMKVRIFDK